ncbi:cAMP-binding domain of CRP or a regulatory subunit of cAMP-dependent protein kinases [Duganella sp. CF458]|uniref:Crp/Fnr family transcriptional regulator n=1 Tax=Duganella sp. CF458 TaxID=1884368 RepID=UPI0008EA709B|nr:Crp/Fnr family transcriptional regulator [Duganella sp. CF458]SFG95934.1 cAMP-binding domain of CRP or a regulatory subunit of cAMP-dependent protein kinases [Duganella sp. CF458]
MQIFFDNPWFARLPAAQAQALLAVARSVRLVQGEVLYLQGDTAAGAQDGLWGVVRGAVRLSVMHADGSEAIVTMAEAGNWFGETALLADLPRSATATAHADTELLAVSAERFAALMQDVVFANAMARLEGERLHAAFGLIADMAMYSTCTRLARRLLMMAHGDLTQAASARSTIAASQDQIAMMLGVGRTTLNRELQALAGCGAIALRYGQIELLDLEALRAAAA